MVSIEAVNIGQGAPRGQARHTARIAVSASTGEGAPRQVAAHLRARDRLIACGLDTVTLEDPAAEDAGAGCRAAEAESEGRPVDEVLSNGQLILQLPTGPATKKNGFGQRIPRPRPGKNDPIGITQNVNDLFGD